MPQRVIFNLDQMDDEPLGDGTSSFTGGMVSNEQANLIAENESSNLLNWDAETTGKITTRQGSIVLGGGALPVGSIIQGMAFYWSGANKYLVVATNGRLFAQIGAGWVQIALGGIFDNDVIEVIKLGRINHVGPPAVYDIGTTVLDVDGFAGPVIPGDKFTLWQRDKGYEYTIASVTPAFPGTTTQITIAPPGTVVKTYDNDQIIIKRFGARVNNAAGYPGGTVSINIDGITGPLGNGDKFVVTGEELIHTISTHTETAGNTTTIGFGSGGTPAIQGEYVASDGAVPIIFALGGNKLFWTDGVLSIHSWDGKHTGNLSYGNIYDNGTEPPPTAVKWIAWFQNRLIAAGPAVSPESIWFSDFGDGTRWDSIFQEMEVGGGESDPIVAVVPWVDANLVVFKQHSIYILNMDPAQNPDPSDPTLLVASYGIRLLTHYVGCPAPQSIAQVGGPGGDIFFIGSDKQVRSLRRTIAAASQQEMGPAVSLDVQNILKRITIDSIEKCTGYYWNNRYFIFTPLDGEVYPSTGLVYSTALNKWSGVWKGWLATAFCTKLLDNSRQALVIGQSNNTVLQWLGDTGADETLPDTYRDAVLGVAGVDIPTALLTRGYTFGDFFNWKTGLNCEFEFFDSLAFVNVSAVLDQLTQGGDVASFDTTTFKPLILPFDIPAVLPGPAFKRKQFDLQHFGQWRELQLYIYSASKKLSLRSIKVTGFIDTVQLQTLESTPSIDSPNPEVLIPFP
jgi:hypothetical protein